MSKKTTNFWCKAETAVFVIAISAGMISTKLTCAAWIAFALMIGVHAMLDREYLEEWFEWLTK